MKPARWKSLWNLILSCFMLEKFIYICPLRGNRRRKYKSLKLIWTLFFSIFFILQPNIKQQELTINASQTCVYEYKTLPRNWLQLHEGIKENVHQWRMMHLLKHESHFCPFLWGSGRTRGGPVYSHKWLQHICSLSAAELFPLLWGTEITSLLLLPWNMFLPSALYNS